MKRIFNVLCIVSLIIIGILCVSNSGQASVSGNYYTEGYYKYTMDSDSVTIISYYGSESKVIIPDHIAALPVTRIESSTFAGNKTVKNVTIPDTVTSIDDDLFSEMKQLKKVIVQSKSITVKVPERCVVVEDYPVYVDTGSESGNNGSGNDGGDNNSENGGSNDSGDDSDKNTGANDVTESDTNKAADKEESFEATGDNIENIGGSNEAGGTGNLQDRPGIITENNKLITVDDTGNLVEIDDESNVKVIDREHKYTIKENEDGEVIITDENDNEVSIEKDGEIKLGAEDKEEAAVKEEAAGDESEDASEDKQGAAAEDNQDETVEYNQDETAEDKMEDESGHYQIVVIGIIIVIFAGAGVVIWRKMR